MISTDEESVNAAAKKAAPKALSDYFKSPLLGLVIVCLLAGGLAE